MCTINERKMPATSIPSFSPVDDDLDGFPTSAEVDAILAYHGFDHATGEPIARVASSLRMASLDEFPSNSPMTRRNLALLIRLIRHGETTANPRRTGNSTVLKALKFVIWKYLCGEFNENFDDVSWDDVVVIDEEARVVHGDDEWKLTFVPTPEAEFADSLSSLSLVGD